NVRVVAVGDERLRAIEHPVATSADRCHARAAGVGTRRRLGQSPRANKFTGSKLRNVFFLLGIVSSKKDVVGTKRSMRGDDYSYRAVHPRKLFDGGCVLHVPHSSTAQIRRKHDAHQTEL